ncbi:MAG: hypothetical protein IKQ69_04505 [Oscillospiraceae bacterium]|nr:hypothetical protein [Oscillospiraceae bacterium]
MEEKKKKLRRLYWLTALAALLLTAAAAMLIYLAGSRGVSADADNPRAILRSYDVSHYNGASLREDGTLEMDLEKADLYWFAREYGLTGPIRDWLGSDGELLSAGFRLSGSTVTISVRRRARGFLPLSYRAEAQVGLWGQILVLDFQKVSLGARIRLPVSQWPSLFRRQLSIDLSGTDLASELLGAELSEGELRLRLAGLTGLRGGTLSRDSRSAAALRLFGLDQDKDAGLWEEDKVAARELCRGALDSGDPRAYLAEAMSQCREEDLPVLWEHASSVARRWLWNPLKQEAELRRQEREKRLAERQKPYENLLLAARESYRSGALGICETGFYNPVTGDAVHPGTLSKLGVTAIDSRIVLLTGREAAPEEMPDLLSVPRKNWLTMEKDMDWKADVDLGVLLTTEGDVPILLYRRGDGTLVLREVTEELYVSAMVSRTIPAVDLDSLAAVTEFPGPAGEGFTGAVIAFLAGE